MTALRHPLIWLGLVVILSLTALTIAQPTWLSRLPTAFDELLNDRRADLLSRNDALSAKVSETEAALASFEVRRAQQAATIEALRAELGDRQSDIQALSTELAASMRQRDALKTDVEALENRLLTDQSTLRETRSTLRERDAEVEVLQHQLAALRDDLSETRRSATDADLERSRSKALKDRIGRLTAERNDLQLRLAEGDLARKEAETQSQRLREERAAMEHELQQQIAASQQLRTTLDHARQETEDQAALLEQRKADLQDLRDQLEDRTQARTALESKLEATAADRTKDEQALGRLQRRIDHLTWQERDLTTRLAQAGQRQSRADQQLEETVTELADQTTRAERLAGEAATVKDALQAAQQAAKAREGDLAALRRELSATTDRGIALQNALRDHRADIAKLKAGQQASGEEIIRLAGLLGAAHRSMHPQQTAIDQTSEPSHLIPFRSAFFDRLRTTHGDLSDVELSADRLSLEADMLFDSGAASLTPAGRTRMAGLAEIFNDITQQMAPEIDWILRVDTRSSRHITRVRAITLVDHLIDNGIPPDRVATNAFAGTQPRDDEGDATSSASDGRIDFTLMRRQAASRQGPRKGPS